MADFKEGIEIERKYIIAMPDVDVMSTMSAYSADSMVQTYLSAPAGVTRRVRMRKGGNGVRYYETVKKRIDGMSAHESEREITKEEYEAMLAEIEEGTVPIRKIRHSFTYSGQVFEVDIYPEWHGTAILETELTSRDNTVCFPDFIRVLREVTGVKGYSNAAMSRRFPDEDIFEK